MPGKLVVRYRYYLLAMVVAMSGYSLWLLPGLVINQSFSEYFPEGDEELIFYRQMTAALGDEDDLMAVAIKRQSGIFDSVFLAKVHRFTLACDTLPFVVKSQSLTRIEEPVRTPFGLISTPFIHLDEPGKYHDDSLRISRDTRLAGRFVSPDLSTLLVSMEIKPSLDARQGQALIVGLENLLAGMGFDETHVAGRKYFEVHYNRLSNRELKKGILLSMLLIAVFLGWMYRSAWGVALPMMVFLLAMLNFLGYLVLIGRSLNATSNLFPTIILISALSDTIHLFSNYEEEMDKLKQPVPAMAATLNEVGIATLLTALATAIGFLAFAISPVPAIKRFGLDVAFGVMLTYVITHILVPFFLIFAKKEAICTKPDFNRWWTKIADRVFDMAIHKRRQITAVTWVLFLLSWGGIYLINTNNLLVSSLPLNHEIRKSARFFEANLAGVRTLEIAIQPGEKHALNELAVLREIEKLHRHLDSLPEVGGAFSPVTVYASLNKSWSGGNPATYRLPDSQPLLEKQEKMANRYARFEFRRIMNEEKKWGKISARMTDLGRQKVARFNKILQTWIAENTDKKLVRFHLTGASMMIDKVQEYSIANLKNGLLLDALAIGLLIALALRQWRMVYITLLTNIYPLFLAAALMGLTGIELRYTTIVIFIIGLVIAADDTTHFLSKYMLARLRNVPEREAIRSTLRETGKPVIITFGVLFLSFAMLIFSAFRDSQAIGILVSFLLLVGVLADLFLVPLLLMRKKEAEE